MIDALRRIFRCCSRQPMLSFRSAGHWAPAVSPVLPRTCDYEWFGTEPPAYPPPGHDCIPLGAVWIDTGSLA